MKKVAILVVLTLATMLNSGAERNSYSTADKNSIDIQLAPEEENNVQETVYEDSDESVTNKASELVLRDDISIEEIYDLKTASEEEIYQKLGEPHGSVSGGSFQQFHYILENGDIVIFSSSVMDSRPYIALYNKNGEFKNEISNEVE